MTRYQAREMTTSGWGRQFESRSLSTVRDIVVHLGGRWRIRRQAKSWDGVWRRDDGRRSEFWMRVQ